MKGRRDAFREKKKEDEAAGGFHELKRDCYFIRQKGTQWDGGD